MAKNTNIDSKAILERIFGENGDSLTAEEKALLENTDVLSDSETDDDDEADTSDESTDEQPDDDGQDSVDDKSAETDEADTVEDSTKDAVEKPSSKSKEVKKIIGQKAIIKEQQTELSSLREKLRLLELKAQYSEKYADGEEVDERATAHLSREKDIRRIEIAEFRLDNADVLARYPDAKADIETVFDSAKKMGWTAEQVCRGMYGETEPLEIRRAKAAVNGKLQKSDTNFSVTKAGAATTTPTVTTLTPEERDSKRKLIQLGFLPKGSTDKDYLDSLNQK